MNDLEDAYFIIETLIEVANRLNQQVDTEHVVKSCNILLQTSEGREDLVKLRSLVVKLGDVVKI